MNAHDEYVDDLALLALDALPADEARHVRAHLSQCEACTAEYVRLREAADVLPLAAALPDSSAPSADLKRRIMAGVEPQNVVPMTAQRKPSFVAPPYLLAAACLIAAIIMGALYAQVSRRAADQSAIIADMTSPGAQHYAVTGGQVLRAGDRVYIAMRNAPRLPAGKVYQAWTLPQGSKRMAPSVTFVPEKGRVLLRLPVNAAQIAAVAVSVEPVGGSAQPTSKPVFVVLFPSKA